MKNDDLLILLGAGAIGWYVYDQRDVLRGSVTVTTTPPGSGGSDTSSGGGGTVTVQTTPPSTDTRPRGIRNNNPGNLVYAGINWQGEIGQDDAGFSVFDSMYNGMRAAAINLNGYYHSHGLKTIDAIIHRWSGGDNWENYAAYVASGFEFMLPGLTNDQIRQYEMDDYLFQSQQVFPVILGSIFFFENGTNNVSEFSDSYMSDVFSILNQIF